MKQVLISNYIVALMIFGIVSGCGDEDVSAEGPLFVVNSPLPDSRVAGTVWFSVQPIDATPIARVTFRANGEEIGTDQDGTDGYRVFLRVRDFSAGEIALSAEAVGADGAAREERLTVVADPAPPTAGTVGPDGAVLATPGGSVVTFPAGVGSGPMVSVFDETQTEFQASTGIDLDALGIAFLGAQRLESSAPLVRPVGTFTPGFGDEANPGDYLAQFTVTPDLDADGTPELIILNDAAITPDGDVLSAPRPLAGVVDDVGGRAAALRTTSSLSPEYRGAREALTLAAAPGELIRVEVFGFNPFNYVGNVADWTSAGGFQEITPAAIASDPDNPNGQLFFTVVPLGAPAGRATVQLEQRGVRSTGEVITLRSALVEVDVGPASASPGQTGQITLQFLEDLGAALDDLPVPEASETVTEFTAEQKQAVRDGIAGTAGEVATTIGDFVDDPTPEQQRALEASDRILSPPAGPEIWDFSDRDCISRDDVSRLYELATYQFEVAAHYREAGEDALADMFNDAGLGMMEFIAEAGADPAHPVEVSKVCEEMDGGSGGGPGSNGGTGAGGAGNGAPSPDLPPNVGSGGPSRLGICAAPAPPGGEGGGGIRPPPTAGDTGLFRLPSAAGQSQQALADGPVAVPEPLVGRFLVRVEPEGDDLADIRAVSDYTGYVYFPFIPAGVRYVATAFDTVTRETRRYEGFGPDAGELAVMSFNFARGEDATGDCRARTGFDRVWLGFVDSSWDNPDNWEPVGVPAAGENLIVCGEALSGLQTNGGRDVGDLLVQAGATVTLNGVDRLNVVGTLRVDGMIDGSGAVRLGGDAPQIQGVVPNLIVDSPGVVTGPTTVTGSAQILDEDLQDDASLSIGPHRMEVQGFFGLRSTTSTLTMDDPAGVLDIRGGSDWSGAANISAGTVRMGGASASFCGDGYRQTGGRLVFDAASTPVVMTEFGCARTRLATSDIELESGSEVTVQAETTASGDLTIPSGASILFEARSHAIQGDIQLAGQMTVGGSATVSADNLALASGSTLDNQGTMTVARCEPNAGAVTGTDPCP